MSDWEVVDDSSASSSDWAVEKPNSAAAFQDAVNAEAGFGGRAASGFLKGVAGFGDLADIANAAGRAFTFQPQLQGPGLGDYTRKLFQVATGVPDPTNIGKGTFEHTAASYFPSMIFGPANALKNAAVTGAQAIGAGLGQVYGGDAGEFVGGMAPMLAPGLFKRGVSAIKSLAGGDVPLIGPVSENAAARTVGDMASEQGITSQQVKTAINAQKADPLGAMKTSAEVLNSPTLAIMEQEMGGSNSAKALAYAEAQKARAGEGGARQFMIDSVSPAKNVPEMTTGQTILDTVDSIRTTAKKKLNDLYDAIPQDVKAPVTSMKRSITMAKNKYYGSGAAPMPQELQDALGFLNAPENKGGITIQELQRVRSRLNVIAKKAGADDVLASMAGAAKSAVTDAIGRAPKGSKAWNTANKAYAEFAQTFKGGSFGKFLSNREGLASNVADQIIKSPESAIQFDRIAGGDQSIMKAVRDHLASHLSSLSDAKRVNFINQNEAQLKTLLKGDFSYLDALRKDIISQSKTAASGNVTRGSNTALKLSSVVQKALTGKDPNIKPGIWERIFQLTGAGGALGLGATHPAIAIPAVVAAGGAAALKARSNTAVQNALYKSLMNPETLQKALMLSEAAKSAPKQGLFSLLSGVSPQGAVGLLGNAAGNAEIDLGNGMFSVQGQ